MRFVFSFNGKQLLSVYPPYQRLCVEGVFIFFFKKRKTWDKLILRKDYIKQLSKIGLKRIRLGVETYSPEKRREMGKFFTNKSLFQGMKICKESNVDVRSSFIIGYPRESEEDINKSLNLIDNIEERFGFISRVTVLKTYPQTNLYKRNKEREPKRRLEDWAYLHLFIKKINKIHKNPEKLECIAHSSYYKNIKKIRRTKNQKASFLDKLYSFLAEKRWKHRFWFFPIEIYMKKAKILTKLFFETVKIKLY